MVRGKDQTPFSVSDFMLKFEVEEIEEEEFDGPSELDLELMRRWTAPVKDRRRG